MKWNLETEIRFPKSSSAGETQAAAGLIKVESEDRLDTLQESRQYHVQPPTIPYLPFCRQHWSCLAISSFAVLHVSVSQRFGRRSRGMPCHSELLIHRKSHRTISYNNETTIKRDTTTSTKLSLLQMTPVLMTSSSLDRQINPTQSSTTITPIKPSSLIPKCLPAPKTNPQCDPGASRTFSHGPTVPTPTIHHIRIQDSPLI